MLLNANNLKKMFSDELLFENVSFQVDENDKIGFVGENGAGKSTLFKILTEQMDYDSGEIYKNKNTKIGYLEQYSCSDSDKTIMEEFLSVFNELICIEEELNEIHYDIENKNGDLDILIYRQNSLNERYTQLDGVYFRSRIKATLIGLGFSEDEFDKKVSKLSGGQKTRVALGKILLSDVNLLLLDEPTNHLDIDSVSWLETFLKGYKGAFIVISHDRYFLDRVCNKMISLEQSRFFTFPGNYSEYLVQRDIEQKTKEREYENTKKEISRLEGIVEQQRRWNREKNIKTAESKLKVIEKLEKGLDEPLANAENMSFRFTSDKRGGNDVLIANNLSKSFNNLLFKNVDMHITKGEKIFLLGPNGCGKTTLLKILLGQYQQDTGEYKIGSNIDIGYYDQIQENLNTEKTIIDEVWDEYPNLTQTEIRNALAVFLFRGDDVFKGIDKLSGGEKARVELVKLMMKKSNFLIMDEPTNHLDIASREALENALSDYDGTMLFVSHDRYFINKLSTRILHLEKSGITSYSGNYDDYIEKYKTADVEVNTTQTKGLDYQNQKKLAAQKRKLMNDFSKTERNIAEFEDDVKILTNELEKPEIAMDYVKAMEITNRISELNNKLEELYVLWSELQEQIEMQEN